VSHVLVPWILDPAAGTEPVARRLLADFDGPLARLIAAGALLLLPVIALLVSPRETVRRHLVAVVAFAFLAVPPLMIFVPNQDNGFNRAFHVLMVPVALVVGATCATLLGRPGQRGGRLRRIVLTGWLLLLVAMAGDSLYQIVSVEREAALISDRTVRSARAAMEKGDPEATWFTTGLDTYHAGVPLVGNAMPWSFKKPFCSSPLRLEYVADASAIPASHVFRSTRGAVGILDWREDTAVVGTLLPGLPAETPVLVALPDQEPGITAWRPESSVPPRVAPGLRFSWPAGEAFAGEAILVSDRGRTTCPFRLEASASRRSMTLALDEISSWVLGRSIESIVLLSPVPPEGAPEFLARPPQFEILEPRDGTTMRMDAPLNFVFRAPPGSARLRLRFGITTGGLGHYPLVYEASAETFGKDAQGHATYGLRKEDFVAGQPDWVRLHRLDDLITRYVGNRLRSVRCSVFLEIVDASGRTVHARAPGIELTLTR
jgi:hypothetical protein